MANNSSDNDEIDNSVLFFKIFRNRFLRFEIFQNLKYYNKYSKGVKFNSAAEYQSFENKVYLTNVHYNFHEILPLPKSVETLKLGEHFGPNRPILLKSKKFLHESITSLELHNSWSSYNRLNDYEIIPKSVTKLNVGQGYSKALLPGDIHSNIKFLKLGNSYREEIKPNIWPENCKLETLKFSKTLSYRITKENSFPIGLKEIQIGYLYGEISPNSFPISLTSMKLTSYHHSLYMLNSLINLERLEITNYVGLSILPGYLPDNLKSLIMESNINQLKIGSLPSSLTHLSIPYYKYDIDMGLLPNSLKTLIIGLTAKTFTQKYTKGLFPDSITELSFGYSPTFSFPFEANVLPKSLKRFIFNIYPFPIEPNVIPNSITFVSMPRVFNQPLSLNILPQSLVNLSIIGHFNQIIKVGTLPTTLKSLFISGDFNSEIEPNSLNNLESLLISGSNYNLQFKIYSLPQSLTELKLPKDYNHSIEYLPKLTTFKIGKYNQIYDYLLKFNNNDEDDNSFSNLFLE